MFGIRFKEKIIMTQRTSSANLILYMIACILVFYSVYYAIGSIVFAIYSLEDFDGMIPFDFDHWMDVDNTCCDDLDLVNTISMFVTFPVCGAIYSLYIPSWVWDFCVTTTIIHIVLSCIVMLDFPKKWTWWLSIGVSSFLMIVVGEGLWHLLDWRKRNRMVVPESTTNKESTTNNRAATNDKQAGSSNR